MLYHELLEEDIPVLEIVDLFQVLVRIANVVLGQDDRCRDGLIFVGRSAV